jgi:hypothetical protein
MRTHNAPKTRVLLALVAFVVTAASSLLVGTPASAAPPKTKIDTPVISCGSSGKDYIDINVMAPGGTGATGLPAGFSIQWTTQVALDANGGVWPVCTTDPITGGEVCPFCKASFSGNASGSNYNLAPGASVTIRIGDILMDNGASTTCPDHLICNTDYVFRAFGHANGKLQRSNFTGNLTCSTLSCDEDGGCDPNVKSFGFWKTHYPNDWPTDVITNGMTVGCQPYTAAQLESILLATPAGGNALVALAHQVINTRLNILNGASAAYVTATAADLLAAETLMCTTGAVPPVGSGSLTGAQASALTLALDTERSQFECGPTAP